MNLLLLQMVWAWYLFFFLLTLYLIYSEYKSQDFFNQATNITPPITHEDSFHDGIAKLIAINEKNAKLVGWRRAAIAAFIATPLILWFIGHQMPHNRIWVFLVIWLFIFTFSYILTEWYHHYSERDKNQVITTLFYQLYQQGRT
jgi:hypothetical protein